MPGELMSRRIMISNVPNEETVRDLTHIVSEIESMDVAIPCDDLKSRFSDSDSDSDFYSEEDRRRLLFGLTRAGYGFQLPEIIQYVAGGSSIPCSTASDMSGWYETMGAGKSEYNRPAPRPEHATQKPSSIMNVQNNAFRETENRTREYGVSSTQVSRVKLRGGEYGLARGDGPSIHPSTCSRVTKSNNGQSAEDKESSVKRWLLDVRQSSQQPLRPSSSPH